MNETAFPGPEEAGLVEALRAKAEPIVSLVAEEDGVVVGHILFSPVTLDGHSELKLMGLAPMAVLRDLQRSGIGSALVKAGLEACRQLGSAGVIVLGHADYYPRFGFVAASRFGIDSEYEVPDESFMAMELKSGALTGKSGRARYHAAFAAI